MREECVYCKRVRASGLGSCPGCGAPPMLANAPVEPVYTHDAGYLLCSPTTQFVGYGRFMPCAVVKISN